MAMLQRWGQRCCGKKQPESPALNSVSANIDDCFPDPDSEDELQSDPAGADEWPDLDFLSDPSTTHGGFALHPIADLEPEVLQSMYDLLIDTDSLFHLQRAGAINDAPDAQRAEWDDAAGTLSVRPSAAAFAALLPVRVAGDGNCLLHAVSRALWGVLGPPG
eukprot:CAMPEP_0172175722 /NCGR_PEP_ID=MMETSP1050-20130122/14392_1 /TAXON_ID=233186 /ORGANISM="Cryptomonas curvata, Strain CCAP979/52" /LENGTH=161 /DNA_ID=CAMNT_0012847869 /DNA_START=99 /DNA_END=581 /DNA_ORIENTATION=+